MDIQKKIIRVIESCRRKEQLEVASRYIELAIKKFPNECFSDIFENFQKKKDEIERISIN